MATIFWYCVWYCRRIDIYFRGCGSSLSFYENLKPNQFVAGNGLFIFIGCVSVGTGYLLSGVLQSYMLLPALFGTLSAFLGFYLGSFLRNFLSPQNFYKIIWFLFLITGIRLAITAISKF